MKAQITSLRIRSLSKKQKDAEMKKLNDRLKILDLERLTISPKQNTLSGE